MRPPIVNVTPTSATRSVSFGRVQRRRRQGLDKHGNCVHLSLLFMRMAPEGNWYSCNHCGDIVNI